jgi:TP901 family phage tail tape measure protein
MEQAGVQLIAAGGDVYISTINNATKATSAFVDGTEQGGGKVNAAGQVMIGALRQIGTMAIDAFAQAAKATAAFVGDSVKVAGDFEAGMLRFQAVAGKGVDTKGLEKFKDLFISLGKELPVSTSEVEQAAIEMVSGGIDPAIVAGGALRQTIQFASAANLSLADAAATSAKFLAGWTSSAATADEKIAFLAMSTDTLTKAAAASSTTAAELRLGLFNVQGAAQALHASFEDTTATLAQLAPAFESSAQAGTALNVFMSRLVPQTSKAKGEMQDLGLITKNGQNIFFDSAGAFLGMGNAAEVLKDKLGAMTDEQKIDTLHQLFGNDAMKVANLLMQDGAAGLDAMKAKMAEANGVSATAALVQSGYNTALENAKGSVEALQITIGSALLPVLSDLLNKYIAPGVNAITAFAESFFKLVPAIEASDDPLQTFLLAIAVAAPGLTDLAFELIHAKDEFLAFIAPAQTVGDFLTDNLKPILFGIGVAITATLVPALVAATTAFLAAAAPIVALVAASALLYKAWDTDFLGIKTTVTQVWNDTLLPAFQAMQVWLADEIPPAIKTLADFWDSTLLPALKDVGAFLHDKVFPILSDLADVFIAGAIIEVKALAAIWSNVLQPALAAVWSYLSGTVIPIFHALFDVEFAIASKVVEALAGLWQKVLWPALKSVGDYIGTTVIPAFKSVGDYLSTTFGPTLNDVTTWLDKVTGGFGGVTGGVKEVINWLENLASSISKLKLPDWLTPGSPTPWETALYGIGTALSKSVAPGLATMQQGITEIGGQINDAFANSDIVDTLSTLGEDAMRGFGKGLKSGVGSIVSLINSTADTVEGAFKGAFQAHSPAERMVPVGESVMQGIMKGMADGWPQLTTLVGSLSADLIGQMQDIGQQMQQAVADGFGATASIDRQIAKNLDSFKDILPQYEQYTTGALKEAQQKAESFLDPAEGAKFFQMRSKQILEYAKLQKDLDEAATQDDRDRINAQMLLINKAQTAEISQFDATNSPQDSPMQNIADQVNAIMKTLAGINLTDDQIKIVDLLSGIFATASTPVQQTASPPASPAQQGWQAGGGASPTNNTKNFNMPIYTNQSPAALQQSLAIAQASMP